LVVFHPGLERRKNPTSDSTTPPAGFLLTFCWVLPLPLPAPSLFHWDFSQSNALHRRPDNSQAAHLSGEHINLVGALPYIAEETFDSIGRSDVSVQRLRKVVKGQRLVFLLDQTAHGLWIEFAVLGFEGSKLGQMPYRIVCNGAWLKPCS
jgi:hypothetical protein